MRIHQALPLQRNGSLPRFVLVLVREHEEKLTESRPLYGTFFKPPPLLVVAD